MSKFKAVEVARGSGNAFNDLGITNADVEQSYIGCAHYKLAK